MIVTTTVPCEEQRQEAREGLAKILARRLFEQWLTEQEASQPAQMAANDDQATEAA